MSKDKKAEAAQVAKEAKVAAEVAVLETKAEAAKVADAVKTAEAKAKAGAKAAGEKVKKEAKAAETKAKKAVKAAGEKVKKEAKAAEAKARKAVKAAEAKVAKVNTFVQFAGMECSVSDVEAKAMDAFKAQHNGAAVKSMTVYVKPEDHAAYYVVNDEFTGKVEL